MSPSAAPSERTTPAVGAGTSTIAVNAGVDVDTVLRCLGVLAGWAAAALLAAGLLLRLRDA